MGKDTGCGVTVQSQPTVAEATEDKPPPFRVSMSDGKPKDKVIASNVTPGSTDKQSREFSERDLPLPLEVSDTTVLGDGEQSEALNAIASRNETVALYLGEDLPNLNANPEKTHASLNKEEPDFGDMEFLKDAKTLDFLSWLINSPHREKLHLNLLPTAAQTPLGKQCPGGNGSSSSKGSQTETSSGQGSFVTGYTGRSTLSNNMVTGLDHSSGGGGGDDEDPFRYRVLPTLSGHYTEFNGYEEQLVNGNSDHRDVCMAVLNPTAASPMLPQFNRNQEEVLSCDPEGLEVMEGMQVDEFDFDITNLNEMCDGISLPVVPTEETLTAATTCVSSQFPVEETPSDIKDSFDMIKMMSRPAQRPQQPTVGITPFANTIPHSQIPGLTATQCPPASPMSSIAPSPLPPQTPLSATTPASPMVPPTPKPQQSQRILNPKTYTEGNDRVCELSVSRDLPLEKQQAALQALFFISVMYPRLFDCAEEGCDLKVANDVQAKLCSYDFHLLYEEGKVQFKMPKDCQPLEKWLSNQDNDLRDRLLILQQVVNTLATLHTLGHKESLALWGSFMVWVASDVRVYLLAEFPMLLQKQMEYSHNAHFVDPRKLDLAAVKDLYRKMILPHISRNESWVSPGFEQVLRAVQYQLNESTSCQMADIARTLGQKRVCRLEININEFIDIFFYCMEQESLKDALSQLRKIAPPAISRFWAVKSLIGGGMMRDGDVATADRQMKLQLVPYNPQFNPSLLCIACEEA